MNNKAYSIGLRGRPKKGNPPDNPRYRVISMRISENELGMLEELSRSRHESISALLRKALYYYIEQMS